MTQAERTFAQMAARDPLYLVLRRLVRDIDMTVRAYEKLLRRLQRHERTRRQAMRHRDQRAARRERRARR